jgi:hypothetical protein
MAGFGMMLAGAAQGFGESIVEQARAKREAALRQREREQERAWQVEDRDRGYAEDRGREDRGYAREDSNIRMGADALEAVFGPGNEGGAERIAQITDFYISKGAPPHVAAGLAGNFMQESGTSINTTAVGDNGNAFGAGQWNGPRRRDLQAFAEENGLDVNDLGTQLEFSWQEMQTTESSAWEAIMGTETAEEAARVASEQYWRPGVPHIERRQQYARTVYEAMSNPEIPADVRERIGNGLGMDPAPADEEAESATAPTQPEQAEPVEAAELSAGLDTRLRRNGKLADTTSIDGEVDEDLLLEVKSEIARLMTEEGLNESQAEIAVLQAITFTDVETSPATGQGWFDGRARPATTERQVTFDYGTGAEPEPDRSQTPEPAMPTEPTIPGLGSGPVSGPVEEAPRNAADRVTGKVYRAPDGRMVRWTGAGWELVNG